MIKELLEKRARCFEQMKEINSRADDKGNLRAEDDEQFSKLNTEYDELTAQIEKAEGNEKRSKMMKEKESQLEKTRGTKTVEDHVDEKRQSSDYSEAYWRVYRAARHEMPDPEDLRTLRALKIGDDSKGGYLAPAEFEAEVISKFREDNIMRQVATVVQSGSDRNIPVERDLPTFSYIPEEGTYPTTDSKWGLLAMKAWKIGGIIKVSEELLVDAYFNLPSYLSGQMGDAGAEAEEENFIAGDGNNKPEGILQGGTLGKETSAVDDFTVDELLEMYHSVHRRYRNRGIVMFNDATALKLRKKKYGDGHYIWQPALVAGEPDRIMNRPVAISEFMPSLGTGNKFLAFGDMRYYRVMDRIGLSIQRLDEKYADTGQIGFKGYLRNDGKLLRPDAVKYMQNA